MPPTPTPMPVVTSAPITFDFSLWDSAPTSVGVWNMAPDVITVAFQALLLLFLIGLVVMIVIKLISKFTSEGTA